MFTDIKDRIYNKVKHGIVDHFLYYDILYADDTLLITKNARKINILIKEIEIESNKYNMKLNKGKCNYIPVSAMNT